MKHALPGGCRRLAAGLPRLALAALLALGAAACETLDDALSVEAASRIPAENLESPTTASLLLAGVIADFECAYGSYVVMSGLVGEELMDASQTANRWPYDRREVSPADSRYATFDCDDLGVYTPLSRTRWAAESLLSKLERWTDAEMPQGINRTNLIAQAAVYSAYSHLLLAEGFCEGVLLNADLTPTGRATRQEIFQRAEQRFTRAIEAAQAAGNSEMLNTARVGRARTRLNLGNAPGAAADAALVPVTFVKNVSASATATRRYNRVFAQNNDSQLLSIAPEYRNLTTAGVADPRTRVTDTERTATDGTRIWVQNKYAGFAAGLPLATGDEAQLILAETSTGQAAVDIINGLRSRAGLPAFAGGTAAQVRAQVVEERRRELFLEGHHLGDVIRYGITLRPATGTTFAKGGTYGATVCLPLPNVETQNNPNFAG